MLKYSDLRPKQLQGIDFLTQGYEALLLADVGTGKTVISLTALLQLLNNEIPRQRALVLAPKRVAMDVWEQEMQEWSHLNNSGMIVKNISGMADMARRRAINDRKNHVIVLNYELLIWLMTEFPEPPFEILVCDEIDKLKDRTSKRFAGEKKEGVWLHRGMKEYAKQFETRIGLTGTPASNGLLDLWAESLVIDGGSCLGRSFNKYQRAYFYPTDYNQKQWAVLPGYEAKIYDRLAPITFRIERDDHIPPLVVTPPRYVDLPTKVRKIYNKFEKELLVHLENGESIESPHAAAGYGRLREITAGFSYLRNEDGEHDPNKYVMHHELKFKELDSLISELQGNQLMIVYQYKRQLAILLDRYKSKIKYLGGGISNSQATATIKSWNDGELPLLAIHPRSAGHGLNLQKSDAHHICMLTLPDSAGLWEQVIGRLRRTGNDAKQIFLHRILARKTVDEKRVAVVQGKIEIQNDFLNEMKKRCG